MVLREEKFNNLNKGQEAAVRAISGPVLIIAGPGTGKTKTLVDRTLHLIRDKSIDPSKISLTTFTKKAAEGLLYRISKKLADSGFHKSDSGIFIGNFHMMAAEIINKAALEIKQRPGWEMLDEAGQFFLISQYLPYFANMKEIEIFFPNFKTRSDKSLWPLIRLLNKLREGFYDLSPADKWTLAARSLLEKYRDILVRENKIDFSELLLLAYEILRDNERVRNYFQERSRYLMVDEYQDTNPIQEKIIRILQDKYKNICVVGDDDQSLYRFRGAMVKNLLNFADRYPNCKTIYLYKNYRSDGYILKRASSALLRDISPLDNKNFLRFDKKLSPAVNDNFKKKSVKLLRGGKGDWPGDVVNSILNMKKAGIRYDQIVILSQSLKSASMQELRQALREAGIEIYINRAEGLAVKQHVRRFLVYIYMILKDYLDRAGNLRMLDRSALSRAGLLRKYLPKRNLAELEEMRENFSKIIAGGGRIGAIDFFYKILSSEEFAPIMEDACSKELDQKKGSADKLKDLAYLIEILFSLLKQRRQRKGTAAENLLEIDSSNIYDFLSMIFGRFLPFFERAGLQRNEEETALAPGKLPIMTIHQAKGLEFPIVFLIENPPFKPFVSRSPENNLSPAPDFDNHNDEITDQHLDRARLYYTARTRAKYLLIEARNPEFFKYEPYFEDEVDYIKSGPVSEEDLKEINIRFEDKKQEAAAYAYTSDIERFEICPRQYLFFRKLNFPQGFSKAATYGSLVHESLQYIQQAYLDQGLYPDIERQREILQKVYGGLWKAGQALDGEDGLRAADSLERYFSDEMISHDSSGRLKDPIWKRGKITEKNLQIAKEDFILYGKVDLILEDGSIVDFKTNKPGKFQKDLYRDQLFFYRLMLSELEGGGHNYLYFTEEEKDQIEDFESSKEDLEIFYSRLSDKIKEIENIKIYNKTDKKGACQFCLLREFCNRGRLF